MSLANVYFNTDEKLYQIVVLGETKTVRLTGEVHKDNPNRIEVQIMSKDKKERRLMYVLEKNLRELE